MSKWTLSADDLKKVACDAIDKAKADLAAVSLSIWKNPELKFEEHFAHKTLSDFLEKYNFPVERHYVLETAFRSIYGRTENDSGKTLPNVSVLCEYDALPGIGHACGHNLIAEVGVGAALGIRAALDAAKDAGQKLGTLTVLGTPGEEGGGGKVNLLRAGAFDAVDISMMAHPFPASSARPSGFIARSLCTVTYHGKASHAAAFPWEGVNALDAAVMAYNNISVLRQQMKPTWKVHGVITNGGAKPNIIPEESSLEYYIRAPTVQELEVFKGKVAACFKAAAVATGCTIDLEFGDRPYDNVISNNTLATLYERNAEIVGFNADSHSDVEKSVQASTDMGNVSHVVPSIHPVYYIGENVFNHTRPFTALAGDEKAQPYTIDVTKALAMSAIDVFCRPELVDVMKNELKAQLETQ